MSKKRFVVSATLKSIGADSAPFIDSVIGIAIGQTRSSIKPALNRLLGSIEDAAAFERRAFGGRYLDDALAGVDSALDVLYSQKGLSFKGNFTGQRASEFVPITVKLAEAGEYLFVGGYGQVRRANIKSGLNSTNTPYNSVQDAVSSTCHSTGVSINMRKDLHAMTRTFRKPVEEGLSLRQHLYKDV